MNIIFKKFNKSVQIFKRDGLQLYVHSSRKKFTQLKLHPIKERDHETSYELDYNSWCDIVLCKRSTLFTELCLGVVNFTVILRFLHWRSLLLLRAPVATTSRIIPLMTVVASFKQHTFINAGWLDSCEIWWFNFTFIF